MTSVRRLIMRLPGLDLAIALPLTVAIQPQDFDLSSGLVSERDRTALLSGRGTFHSAAIGGVIVGSDRRRRLNDRQRARSGIPAIGFLLTDQDPLVVLRVEAKTFDRQVGAASPVTDRLSHRKVIKRWDTLSACTSTTMNSRAPSARSLRYQNFLPPSTQCGVTWSRYTRPVSRCPRLVIGRPEASVTRHGRQHTVPWKRQSATKWREDET